MSTTLPIVDILNLACEDDVTTIVRVFFCLFQLSATIQSLCVYHLNITNHCSSMSLIYHLYEMFVFVK